MSCSLCILKSRPRAEYLPPRHDAPAESLEEATPNPSNSSQLVRMTTRSGRSALVESGHACESRLIVIDLPAVGTSPRPAHQALYFEPRCPGRVPGGSPAAMRCRVAWTMGIRAPSHEARCRTLENGATTAPNLDLPSAVVEAGVAAGVAAGWLLASVALSGAALVVEISEGAGDAPDRAFGDHADLLSPPHPHATRVRPGARGM
eukprot:scaffold84150_cov32-Tisochrysis_lutea.AAC.1